MVPQRLYTHHPRPDMSELLDLQTGLWLILTGVATIAAVYQSHKDTLRLRLLPSNPLGALGLNVETPGKGQLEHEGVTVRVHWLPDKRAPQLRNYTFRTPHIDAPFSLDPKSLTATLLRSDTLIGEASFDERVTVASKDEAILLATLNVELRDLVLQGLAAGLHFDDGWVWPTAPITEELAATLGLMVRLHQATRLPTSRRGVGQGLLRQATKDRCPAIRLRCLELLNERGQTSQEILAACQADVHAPVRFLAASLRGEPGRSELLRMLRDTNETWALRAAIALASLGPGPDLALVEDSLLAGAEHPTLGDEALQGLAQVGTARVMPALRALPRRPTLAHALSAIRARLGDHAVGGLTLASTQGGDLSIASTTAGELSHTEPS